MQKGTLPVNTLQNNLKSTWLGKFVYHFIPVRRQTVLGNMKLVFGASLTEPEIKRLAQHFYRHLLLLCLENIGMLFMTKRRLRQKVRIVGQEHVLKAAEQKKGVLLLTGHFGNWELAPVGGILQFEQFKGRFHILRRPIVNKTVEKILFKRFYDAGLDIMPKKNSLQQVMDALSRNDVVTFIMDQHAKTEKDGVLVDFFGKKAGTFKSLAMIVRTTGAPVIPARCYRTHDGVHIMEFGEPLPWITHADLDSEILENTRSYNQTLEKMILEHPEQWWWVHRRWKVA